jgi:phenylpyruvate tautomerase PptA (4-oxalocrotonate tautomerase family)
MPMIDFTVPRGALSEEVKADLMAALSRTVLKWEGAGNKAAESIAWSFLHEPALATVFGQPLTEPRYRLVVGIPQGLLDDEAKLGMVVEMTDQVLQAEKNGAEITRDDRLRVWVIINEVIEGNWGGGGQIFRLADNLRFTGSDEEEIARRSARLPQHVTVGS